MNFRFKKKTTLNDIGYHYDSEGTLRRISTSKQFKYTGNADYEIVAAAMQLHVQEKLMHKMKRKYTLSRIPVLTANLSSKKILVVIQGRGRVEPGVWACSICMNDIGGLYKGTMIAHLDRALKEDYGVIMLNPNHHPTVPLVCHMIPGVVDKLAVDKEHVIDAWKNIILPLAKKGAQVDVIAHSYGGYCFLNLLNSRTDEVVQHVHKVAFTDSYNSYAQVTELSNNGRAFLANSCINYACSPRVPFGQQVEKWRSMKNMRYAHAVGIPCVSAECDTHAMTNYASLDDNFVWFAETTSRNLVVCAPPTEPSLDATLTKESMESPASRVSGASGKSLASMRNRNMGRTGTRSRRQRRNPYMGKPRIQSPKSPPIFVTPGQESGPVSPQASSTPITSVGSPSSPSSVSRRSRKGSTAGASVRLSTASSVRAGSQSTRAGNGTVPFSPNARAGARSELIRTAVTAPLPTTPANTAPRLAHGRSAPISRRG